jgi:hypothetical protein
VNLRGTRNEGRGKRLADIRCSAGQANEDGSVEHPYKANCPATWFVAGQFVKLFPLPSFLFPRRYGQLVTKVLGRLTIVAPRAVAPIRTIWPLERTALLIGPMIGSRSGTTETRW